MHSEFAPKIEHVRVTVPGADARDDGGPVDAIDRLQHEPPGCHQRAGVAGADAGIRLAGFHQVDRDAHRGVFLAAQGFLRLLVHGHDLRRLLHANARAQLRRRIAQQLFDRLAQTDQHDMQVGLGLERGERARAQ